MDSDVVRYKLVWHENISKELANRDSQFKQKFGISIWQECDAIKNPQHAYIRIQFITRASVLMIKVNNRS